MGLTNQSTGAGAMDTGLHIERRSPRDRVVALAGNPNVGKSTVFNALTGLNQHTGNWPGKTVASAQGYCETENNSYVLVDIPGAYSLMAHSQEEEVARNFLCFGAPDAVVVVADATCLERNLNLVLQTVEIAENVVVCVNLLDEAERKGIRVDLCALEQRLGVPVVGVVARRKGSLAALTRALDALIAGETDASPRCVRYAPEIERAILSLEPLLEKRFGGRLNARWLSLRLLDCDETLLREIEAYLGERIGDDPEIAAALRDARAGLSEHGARIGERIASALVSHAHTLSRGVVTFERVAYDAFDRRLDRVLTGRFTAYPIMLCLLAVLFWITIVGANDLSAMLSSLLFGVQDWLTALFFRLRAPDWLHGALVLGVYRTLAWVVSVMLPPMAIFFPLFTLLEDAGYLPRIAYNLDKPFKRCHACGKQALTMWVRHFRAFKEQNY